MPPSISISSRKQTTTATATHLWSGPMSATGSTSTADDDRIYGPDWRAWVDPEVPDEIAPTALLLDRHLGTPVEHKTALIVDGEAITYGALTRLVATVSTALVARGVGPEGRILLFGTDSLDYVAMWLGAVPAGAVPAVVSD